MGGYRTLDSRFWSNPWATDNLTAEDKYFYLYCMTNPHTKLCGVYEISTRTIASEMALDRSSVLYELDRLQKAELIDYDVETREIFLRGWMRQNWNGSPKWQSRALREIWKIKSPLLRLFARAEFLRIHNLGRSYFSYRP